MLVDPQEDSFLPKGTNQQEGVKEKWELSENQATPLSSHVSAKEQTMRRHGPISKERG